ncbi:serine-rich adhesin for platelets [Uranotaenia lowii]|uniref:serine-rich adhesin for platelets n=1 Tax=Uranotaenia lowii TaxID=190385 RepID=UPI00247A9E53|nr:serine-rich adhesin for platelets [Uranotaenia lowii]
MSSQIPPLVCHTPPPMDFGDEEDDVVIPDHDDDDFDDFASAPQIVGHEDLPTPVPPVLDSPIHVKKFPDLETNQDDKSESISPQLAAERLAPPMESPPSLVLSQPDYSGAENENLSDDDDEFQDFAFHSEQPPTEIGCSDSEGFQLEGAIEAESVAEDNLSIPSLHLDSDVISNKSVEPSSTGTTPVPSLAAAVPGDADEETTSERNLSSSPQEPYIEDPDPEPGPAIPEAAAAITPIVADDFGYRFEDNTENDFTDFTSASNERSSAVLEVPTANDVSFDDDFAQLESTPSVDSNFVSQSKTDFATFDADFSKFDSFQASFPATSDEPTGSAVSRQEEGAAAATEKEAAATNDDFDDFQEFAKFPEEPVNVISQVEQKAATIGSDDYDDEDDDFGEFSDFKQSSEAVPVAASSVVVPTTSKSIQFSNEAILAVISTMFPSVVAIGEAGSADDDTGQQAETESSTAGNKLCQTLLDLDSTHAISYQYGSSESSKELVRALGIDSRNILFGPKWNSSMPRFAANLSFSPLEPMKPTSTTSTTTTTSSSSSVTGFSGASASKPPAEIGPSTMLGSGFTLDPLHHSSGDNPSLASGMPVVQFDWNSSGLVNPLDASHAHTLLLDLEQLEVMANLKDKINLDSSSSSCNIANIVPLISTTTTTTTPPQTSINTRIIMDDVNNITTKTTTNHPIDHGTSLLDDINLFGITTTVSVNNCLPSWTLANRNLCDTTVVACTSNPDNDTVVAIACCNTSSSPPPSTATATPISPTRNNGHGHHFVGVAASMTCENTITATTTTTTSSSTTFINNKLTATTTTNNNLLLQSFDDYLDLSVQEILQEGTSLQQQSIKDGSKGKILDTQVTEKSSPAAANEVIEAAKSASPTEAIVYDEGSLSRIKLESEFEYAQSMSISATADGFSSAAPATTIDSMTPGGNNVVRTIKLPETHIFTPSKAVNAVSRDSTDRTDVPYAVEDKSYGDKINQSIAVREYRDVEYSLEKSSAKVESSKGSGGFDEFREFQAIEMGSAGTLEEPRHGSNDGCRLDKKDKPKSFSRPVFGRSPTEELEQIDDEFSDFQAAVPAAEVVRPAIVNKPLTAVANEVNRSNTSSPILLSPSILLPQQTQANTSMESRKASQIMWPDPGISSEELARFEAAFPAPKASVITNTSKTTSPKNAAASYASAATTDEDEWTDFVYSKPITEKQSPNHSNKQQARKTVNERIVSSQANKGTFASIVSNGATHSASYSPSSTIQELNSEPSKESSTTEKRSNESRSVESDNVEKQLTSIDIPSNGNTMDLTGEDCRTTGKGEETASRQHVGKKEKGKKRDRKVMAADNEDTSESDALRILLENAGYMGQNDRTTERRIEGVERAQRGQPTTILEKY